MDLTRKKFINSWLFLSHNGLILKLLCWTSCQKLCQQHEKIIISNNMTWGKLAIKFLRSRGKICESPRALAKSSRGKGEIWSLKVPEKLCYHFVILSSPRKTLRVLPAGNLLFSGKQRISLSTNFPVHVKEGKLVGKEILCLPLNLPLA